MRKIWVVASSTLLAACAYADLQNVQVGGEIRIRARYWSNVYSTGINGPAHVRIPTFLTPGRAVGPFGINSRYDFDDANHDLDLVEHRTRLNVTADFTDNVKSFVEIESYDFWGRDFRSNYVTGADFPQTVGPSDMELYQAYIEIDRLLDYPLRLRIGRQEMKYGKGWLMDDIATAIFGRSYDAVRLTYTHEAFDIDAFYAKLVETFAAEEDGDVDLSGVYATYKALDYVDLSAYWIWIRDARSLNDTSATFVQEWFEDVFDFDDYDTTSLHTVGLRAFGNAGNFDYDWELAYQFGEADAVGFFFKPAGGVYGDDGAEFDAWATDAEAGYTFDARWSPRIFVGGAYFEGEDNRDLSFWEWLNPFDRPEASLSFNRLFPGTPYSPVLEIGQDMSNFWQVRAGVNARLSDSVTGGIKAAYYGIVEPFDWPRYVTAGRWRIFVAPNLAFWTQQAADDYGWATTLFAKYDYSKDLYFRVVWEHFFPGDGASEGSFLHRNGLEFSGGTDDDGADYIHFETGLKF